MHPEGKLVELQLWRSL